MLDYIRLGLFTIKAKILKLCIDLTYQVKIKIYLIQYIATLKPVYENVKLLVYKVDTYRGQEENKQEVLRIISYKDIKNKIQYKVK